MKHRRGRIGRRASSGNGDFSRRRLELSSVAMKETLGAAAPPRGSDALCGGAPVASAPPPRISPSRRASLKWCDSRPSLQGVPRGAAQLFRPKSPRFSTQVGASSASGCSCIAPCADFEDQTVRQPKGGGSGPVLGHSCGPTVNWLY